MAVNEERKDQTAPGVTRRGFAGRFLGAVQNRLFAARNPSRLADNQEAVAPDARITAPQGQPPTMIQAVDNQDVADLNAEILAASEENIELLHREIYDMVDPADASGDPLVEARSQAIDDRKAMQETNGRGEFDADVPALRQKLAQLQASNAQLRANQAYRALAEIEPEDFFSDAAALHQSRKHATGPARERGANPLWRQNSHQAKIMNGQLLTASSVTVALLDSDIKSLTRPSDRTSRDSLKLLRDEVSQIRGAVEESIAQDKSIALDTATKDDPAYGWTDEELAAQKKLVSDLGEINERLIPGRQLRAIEYRGAAREPGVGPATGLVAGGTIPALNAVAAQRTTHRRAAAGAPKSAGRAVVMNPRHAAGLQGLEDHQDDGLESEGGNYNR